uniref:Putative carboxypeptidase S n=1 Tax=Moniliophthora roreri TaxID=221103 RepID=A0A0W0GA04_MONRR
MAGEKAYSLSSTAEYAQEQARPKSGRSRAFRRLAIFTGLLYLLFVLTRRAFLAAGFKGCGHLFAEPGKFGHGDSKLCSQYSELVPKKNSALWSSLGETFDTEEFKIRAIDWLAGAIQVPTESYDNMDPVGVDPRWETFSKLHEYLATAFPLVSVLRFVMAKLQINSRIDTQNSTFRRSTPTGYSLNGLEAIHRSNPFFSQLIKAHVVPVDSRTADEWNHPPYSGFFDGERIWGRGASDDKSGLIGSLSAIESLLEGGFQPTRTIVLAYGFDEEARGREGAQALGKAMLETYGENSIAFVVDEGGGFTEQYGTVFSTPGIAEKGGLDTRVEVTSPGGHSSVPPSHTSIGILSKLLVEFEDHPYDVKLTRNDVLYDTLQCYGEHAKRLPSDLRKAIKRSVKSDKALKKLQGIVFEEDALISLVGTTQAIDLIQGGVKSNALPEQAWAVVNHRISTQSSLAEAQQHDTELLKKLAEKFNLTYSAFGVDITEPDAPHKGRLTLSDAFGNALEPAPVTPTSGPNAIPYEILSGTIKATYNAHRKIEGENIIIAPGMPTGNTDTRYYWKLTDHIFRYNHKNSGNETNRLANGVHTVNEHIELDAFLEIIRFFLTLILNTDESTVV